MTEPSSPSATSPVVFKKYGNRRLYDTSASRYVTLQEVEAMVQRGTDIQVVDAKTGEDLTKEILVQIILDKDGAREMLPTSFLKQVVRLSSSPLKETFTRTVQDALDGFLGGQRALFDAQRAMLTNLPAFTPWSPFASFGGPPPAPPQAAAAPQPSARASRDSEVDRLRAEVSETQALLRQLIQQQQQQHPQHAPPPPQRAAKRRARAR